MDLTRFSEAKSHESSVINLISSSGLQKVDKRFSLSCKTVDNVFRVVGDWSLEEKAQIWKNWSQRLLVNTHSGEKLSQNYHVDHQWSSEEGVFADVVSWNRVHSVHENCAWIFIKRSFWVLNERNVFDNDLMIDVVVFIWIKNFIWIDCIIQNSGFRDFLRLEALVFLKIFAIVVS